MVLLWIRDNQGLPGAGVKTGFTPFDPAGVKTPAPFYDPVPNGVMAPEKYFDPGPAGVTTPEKYFDPGPGGAGRGFGPGGAKRGKPRFDPGPGKTLTLILNENQE